MDVVTGAFSYTGRWIAERLLASGREVATLARAPRPAGSSIRSAPLQFADEEALVRALVGADTLYNTYWIRFERGAATFARAVANTRLLLRAARRAGVRRIVQLSVTNASLDSPLPYFRGKAEVDRAVASSGLSYAIVRPTLVFGPEDILVNNIAWGLRHFPLFLVPGRGDYRLQPVSVADTARVAVEAGSGEQDLVLDCAGPETITFAALVRLLAAAIGVRRRLVEVPPAVALVAGRAIGWTRRDVLLTKEELAGLRASLLTSTEPPRGSERFSEWVAQNADLLGRRYVSELARNFRPYAPL
ncbi:MAG TPA: NAD(P)H-binding protein [Gaiellaceae bacterium]|nr:NAD(P)H-binding protein [Gaiellaceae bacterium]